MSRGRCDRNTADDGACETDGEHQDKVIIIACIRVGRKHCSDFIIISLRCVAPITIQ